MSTRAEPFSLHVPDQAISELRERLARTRFPDQAPGAPWAYGTDVDYMRELVRYWRETFDWRAQEALLNAFPQYKVPLHGIEVHFLHVEGRGPDPFPLLLSHGWPGSVLEFLELIPRLVDPARFGGDPADGFTVVAPSLPGYGLSFAPGQPLAAWIVEKFRAWSDCGGDVESVFTKDQLLANIGLWWFTGAIGSSFWPYYARMHGPWPIPHSETVDVPAGYAEFPREILRPPRSLAARTYTDVRRWSVMSKGGYFAAMEQPDALAQEIREFFRPLRAAR